MFASPIKFSLFFSYFLEVDIGFKTLSWLLSSFSLFLSFLQIDFVFTYCFALTSYFVMLSSRKCRVIDFCPRRNSSKCCPNQHLSIVNWPVSSKQSSFFPLLAITDYNLLITLRSLWSSKARMPRRKQARAGRVRQKRKILWLCTLTFILSWALPVESHAPLGRMTSPSALHQISCVDFVLTDLLKGPTDSSSRRHWSRRTAHKCSVYRRCFAMLLSIPSCPVELAAFLCCIAFRFLCLCGACFAYKFVTKSADIGTPGPKKSLLTTSTYSAVEYTRNVYTSIENYENAA